MPERLLSTPQWLTLEQASKRLGVHPTTLRRWADEGAVGVFVTPGGHRRFLPADLDRFAEEHHRSHLPANRESGWADHAIAHARQSLRTEVWAASYDEEERENQRYLGRTLMGLVLQYVVQPTEDSHLLEEARRIGAQHAQNAMRHGRSLLDLLKAISFFRTTLLEVVLLETPRADRGRNDADAHLLRRIERLVGEVEAGVVVLYLGDKSPCE